MEKRYFESKFIGKMGYLLHVPENLPQSGRKLMIFLHGAGERGEDLEVVKVNGIPKLLAEGMDIPAVVICPQCPSGIVWTNIIFAVKELIDKTVEEFNIDKNLITITGISMGGFGTWEMGITYPEMFAAIAPVCGGGMSWRADALKDMPIWAFHGDADETVPPKNSYEMVDKVNSCGGNAKLTVFHGVAHNSWTPAYRETKLIDWLLEQRKG